MGEGEGGMAWENSIETYIVSYVKQITCLGLMHEAGCSGLCIGMTLRDEMGREVGGGSGWGAHVHSWLIHVNVWQNYYNIVISLQLK